MQSMMISSVGFFVLFGLFATVILTCALFLVRPPIRLSCYPTIAFTVGPLVALLVDLILWLVDARLLLYELLVFGMSYTAAAFLLCLVCRLLLIDFRNEHKEEKSWLSARELPDRLRDYGDF